MNESLLAQYRDSVDFRKKTKNKTFEDLVENGKINENLVQQWKRFNEFRQKINAMPFENVVREFNLNLSEEEIEEEKFTGLTNIALLDIYLDIYLR